MAGLTGIAPAQSLYNAFPVAVTSGETGEVSLSQRGSPLDPQHLGIVAKNRNLKREFEQDPYPAPYDFEGDAEYILPGTLVNPDQTPRTHAAPWPGWAGNYNDGDEMSVLNENIMDTHSEDFGALARRKFSPRSVSQEPSDIFYNTSIGDSNLQPLTGQVRRVAGYDAEQGYGGGGKGPGGINRAPTGKGKYTRFTNAQPTYMLDSSERPFVVPQGGINARFTDTVQGPQGQTAYGWSYADAASPYDNASAYEPPSPTEPFSGQYLEGPIV